MKKIDIEEYTRENEGELIPTTQEIEQIKELFARADGTQNFVDGFDKKLWQISSNNSRTGSWEYVAYIGKISFHTFKLQNDIVTYLDRDGRYSDGNPPEVLTIKENVKATKDNIKGQFSQALIVWLIRCTQWDRINQLGIFQEVAA